MFKRKDYTLELHVEMKTIYENIDKFDFYKWHQEKKNYYEDTLCGYFNYYQRVYHIFYCNNISCAVSYKKRQTITL